MLDHARTRPRYEVCGLLGGKDGLIQNYYPVDNIAEDRRRSFLMDPDGQLRVIRLMRDCGESMNGIFHTHPFSPALPSARDLSEARYPNVYYLIMSFMRSVPDISAFWYDGLEFENVSLIVGSDLQREQDL